MLQEVFGYSPHHNNKMHLAGEVPEEALWKSCWMKLDTQSDSWYSTPPGKAGCQFTAVLAEERRGVLDRKWDSERPLVFSHVVLTSTLRERKAREIRLIINHWLDLWEKGMHTGLVRDALVEGRSKEGHVERCKEEEEYRLARIFHITLISRKL